MPSRFSIIIPARNEAVALRNLLPELKARYSEAEILVVDDGSTDDTRQVCDSVGVTVISNIYSMGNGAAVKRGARAAVTDILVFMDGDGQHQPEDVSRLLKMLEAGYDMVVGSRGWSSQAGMHRAVANDLFSQLASWVVGHPIADLTSGFRAVRADKFRQFLYLLPNGFSYPTTITMSFFRAGYSVGYIPIQVSQRNSGSSHIRPMRDGMRFLLIIFKVGTLYSPLKLFFPISAGFFLLGAGYYLYTYLTLHRFTNMSALLFITSLLVFMMGLISEQITNLIYRDDRSR
jgi:glycosyltransferase involved in cell wall biosynthesis